jgi:glyoxylase-like metal-dependent hydrolase (beta-lactamase superfamily II)
MTLDAPRRVIGRVQLVPSDTRRLSANSLYVAAAGLLIDTGADEAELTPLVLHVKQVLYTHYHSDHRWNGELFAAAETTIHTRDAAAMESLEGMVDCVVDPASQEPGDIAAREGYRQWFGSFVKPLRVDRRLESEAPVDFGGVTVAPLHMPGHTPGMLCPYFPEERLLFLTDFDLTRFGPWYGNTGSDLDQFEASLQRIAAFDADWFMTSHLPGALDRAEMLALLTPFHEQIRSRDERLVEAVGTPQTLDDLAQLGVCYRKAHLRKEPHLAFFERLQIEHHLRRLARRGAVRTDGNVWERV